MASTGHRPLVDVERNSVQRIIPGVSPRRTPPLPTSHGLGHGGIVYGVVAVSAKRSYNVGLAVS